MILKDIYIYTYIHVAHYLLQLMFPDLESDVFLALGRKSKFNFEWYLSVVNIIILGVVKYIINDWAWTIRNVVVIIIIRKIIASNTFR